MNIYARSSLLPSLLLLLLGLSLTPAAFGVTTFVENFDSGASNWRDAGGFNPLAWSADGGPGGVGDAHVTTTFSFQNSAEGNTSVMFRGPRHLQFRRRPGGGDRARAVRRRAGNPGVPPLPPPPPFPRAILNSAVFSTDPTITPYLMNTMPHKNTLLAATAFALVLSSPLLAEEPTPASRPESFEKDRQSILAMAGNFKVVFRFDETFALAPDYTPKEDYEEHAVETVKVLRDDGDVIVLQHILMPEDSNRIVKHWKQTWRYEDRDIYSFKGNNTWNLEQISEDSARGAWSQEVSQVDDSPRYEASAKWVHEHNLSYWQAPPTRRPLPRRDLTTRKDYDVLITTNRHTITPTGWMHEQDSYKQNSTTGTVLCREAGLNSYDRDDSLDVSRANKYWDETSDNWAMISRKWDETMTRDHAIVLRSEVDGKRLYELMFELAKNQDATEGDADTIFTRFLVRGQSAGE